MSEQELQDAKKTYVLTSLAELCRQVIKLGDVASVLAQARGDSNSGEEREGAQDGRSHRAVPPLSELHFLADAGHAEQVLTSVEASMQELLRAADEDRAASEEGGWQLALDPSTWGFNVD
jgi:hypothetical protein